MKISLVIFALLSIAHSLMVPPRAPSVNESLITLTLDNSASGLVKRADEWTLVLYNEHKKGGQCGGTSTRTSGDSDKCVDIKKKKCVDIHVEPNVAACYFNFKSEGCSEPYKTQKVVQGGTDSNGVDISDDIQFVSVGCTLGGRMVLG